MPAASMADATVSPMRARIGLPSIVTVSVAPVSPSLLNMEPPRAEGSDQRRIEFAARDHRRYTKGVVGGERNAGMAADGKGAGMRLRLVVDREAVLGHDPDRTPGAHDVDVLQQREHPHRARGLGGADADGEARRVDAVFLGVADHDGALV